MERESWQKERTKLKQRNQYIRDAWKVVLWRTALRFGRDKLIMVIDRRRANNMRIAFERWKMHFSASHERARLRRKRDKLKTAFDRVRGSNETFERTERELERAQKQVAALWAFFAWKFKVERSKRMHGAAVALRARARHRACGCAVRIDQENVQ